MVVHTSLFPAWRIGDERPPLGRDVGFLLLLAGIACLAIGLSARASAQDIITLPLDENGEPILPPGAVLETAYVIDGFAGTGERGFSGDGGPASLAALNGPAGVAVDQEGNVYLADSNNGRVRRIDIQGRVSTIAGNGATDPDGPYGDHGPALDARLLAPTGLAIDAAGNLYVTDPPANRVRRIDTSGIITTIAGTGEEGSGGDGGPAIDAQLNQPLLVAVGGRGSVFVSEYGGKRIRKIDPDGTITTLAGNAMKGYSGDGGPATQARLDFVAGIAVAPDGSVYFTDLNGARVRRIDPAGTITSVVGTGEHGWSGDGGPASEAEISTPSGIAFDAHGNLFLTEYWSGRIRRVDPAGIIATIAGIGEQRSAGDQGLASIAALDRPLALAADSSGSLFVTEAFGHRVRVLRPTAQQAQLSLVLGSSGDRVLLTVGEGGVVRLGGQPLANGFRVAARNGKVYTIWQTFPGSIVTVYVPERQSVVLGDGSSVSLWNDQDGVWRIGRQPVHSGYRHGEAGKDYVLEWTGERWRVAQYTIRTVAGSVDVADGIPAIDTTLFYPHSVAVDSAGNVYLTDSFNHRVRKVDAAGVISTLAGTGERGLSGDGGPGSEAELDSPKGIAVSSAGDVFFVDSGNDRVRRIDPSGVITTVPIQFRLSRPHGLAVDAAGNTYVSDESFRAHVVWRVDPNGAGTVLAGVPGQRGGYSDGASGGEARLYSPRGLAVDAAGNTYVADAFNHRVRRIDASGNVTTIAGNGERGFSGDGGPAVEASLYYPSGVAADSTGNVYVSDSSSGRVRRIDAAGNIETIAGAGDGGPAEEAQLSSPLGIAVAPSGEVLISETGGHRIRKVDAEGSITTLAGTGVPFEKRNGGPAWLAQFGYPYDVSADSAGNAYVADWHQIRKIGPYGIISVVAGTGEPGFSGDGGPATEARLRSPRALALDALGNLYVGGLDNRIRRIDPAGTITTIAGTGERGSAGDGGPATRAQLDQPTAIAVDSVGNVYFAEYSQHRVRRIDRSGVITAFAGTGVPDRTHEFGYVLSTGESSSDYSPQPGGIAPAGRTRLTSPFGVAVDGDDNVYVADRGNRSINEARVGRILASSPDREIMPLPFREVPRFSVDLAVDAAGSVFLTYSGAVMKYMPDGLVSIIAGRGVGRFRGRGEPAAGVTLGRSLRLGLDPTGNVWVADSSSRRVHVLEPVP